MNVAISTFARRGHLLAAFAAAVLLAASSGTAWAQTIGFRTARGTLQEGASNDAATPAPLKVTIGRSSGNFDKPDGDDEGTEPDTTFEEFVGQTAAHLALEVVEYDGSPLGSRTFPFTIQARSGDDATPTTVTPGSTATFGFEEEASRSDGVATTIELTIQNTTADNGDWNDETFVLKLSAVSELDDHLSNTGRQRKVNYGTRQLTVTVTDDDPTPKLRFDKMDIQLAKGNSQPVTVGVGVGASGRGPLPGDSTDGADASIHGKLASLSTADDDILLSVEPADAFGKLITIMKSGETTPLASDGQGRYNIGMISDAVSDTGIALTIKAEDISSFRDQSVSLLLTEGRTEAQKVGDGGPIEDSNPVTVTILSGEETPTVTFSTEAIDIDEGDSETVHLLADTDQGSEVGSATVRVTGDALISLSQGGSSISGGTVSFDGSANAELTITALMDRELEDGEEKTATVTITDASGANIGDPRALTVTVVGATAVPALPLIGQLLLALFLMAGGSRLYRRRQS